MWLTTPAVVVNISTPKSWAEGSGIPSLAQSSASSGFDDAAVIYPAFWHHLEQPATTSTTPTGRCNQIPVTLSTRPINPDEA
jgi:hypothetical protein